MVVKYDTLQLDFDHLMMHFPPKRDCTLSLIKTRPHSGRHQGCLITYKTTVCYSLHNTLQSITLGQCEKVEKLNCSFVWLQICYFLQSDVLEDSCKPHNTLSYRRFLLLFFWTYFKKVEFAKLCLSL